MLDSSVEKRLSVVESLLEECLSQLSDQEQKEHKKDCSTKESMDDELAKMLRKQVELGIPVGRMNTLEQIRSIDRAISELKEEAPSYLFLGEIISVLGTSILNHRRHDFIVARECLDKLKSWKYKDYKERKSPDLFATYPFTKMYIHFLRSSSIDELDGAYFKELWRVAFTNFPIETLRTRTDVLSIGNAIAQLDEAGADITIWEPLGYIYYKIDSTSGYYACDYARGDICTRIISNAIKECSEYGLLGTRAIWFFISKAERDRVCLKEERACQ